MPRLVIQIDSELLDALFKSAVVLNAFKSIVEELEKAEKKVDVSVRVEPR